MRAGVDEHAFAKALAASGRLSAEETASRKLVEVELQRLAEDFIERWTHA
jgi:hypothetical protein